MSIAAFVFFVYSLSKNLEFTPVASAMTAVHRDCVVLASYTSWPEIQPLVPRSQIASADPLLLTDGQAPHSTKTL